MARRDLGYFVGWEDADAYDPDAEVRAESTYDSGIALMRNAGNGLHYIVRPIDRFIAYSGNYETTLSDANKLMYADDLLQLVRAADHLGPLGFGDVYEIDELTKMQKNGDTLVEADERTLAEEYYCEPGDLFGDTDLDIFSRDAYVADALEAIDAFPAVNLYSWAGLATLNGDSSKVVLVEPLLWWVLLRSLLSVLMRLAATARREQDESTVLDHAGFSQVFGRFVSEIGHGGRNGESLFYLPLCADVTNRHHDFAASRLGNRDSEISNYEDFQQMLMSIIGAASSICTIAGRDDVMILTSGSKTRRETEMAFGGSTDLDSWRTWFGRGFFYLAVRGDPAEQGELAERLYNAINDFIYSPTLTLTYWKNAVDEINVEARDLPTALWANVRDHPKHYLLTCEQCHRTVYSTTRGPERRFCRNACRMAYSRAHSRDSQ